MSQEERDKLEWLKRAKDKVISQREQPNGWESVTAGCASCCSG